MNERQQQKLAAHFDKYFEQKRAGVLHNENDPDGIDVFLYEPTQKYPYWKLVTAGASDAPQNGDRAEFMLFADWRLPMIDGQGRVSANVLEWYYNVLLTTAEYPKQSGKSLMYRKVLEFDCGGEMRGITALLPKVIDDTGIFTCRLNESKTVHCYLLVTITASELAGFKKYGVDYLDNYFFPPQGKIKCICEPIRTEF